MQPREVVTARRPDGGWPGPVGQLRALIGLRWSTLPAGARALTAAAVLVSLVSVPAALAVGVVGWSVLPPERAVEAAELTPGLLLVLAVGLLVSAVASPGGRQLVPRQHLVAYPLSPTAEHLAGLLLVPANLAWVRKWSGRVCSSVCSRRQRPSRPGQDATVSPSLPQRSCSSCSWPR